MSQSGRSLDLEDPSLAEAPIALSESQWPFNTHVGVRLVPAMFRAYHRDPELIYK
jgi:hypothetical protein